MKQKKCQGNYRTDKFEGCGNLVFPFRYGLGTCCFNKWVKSGSEKAEEYIDKVTIKVKVDSVKTYNKDQRDKKKKLKESIKSITDWKKDLQDVVNWIVREIDKDYKCISHPDMKGFLRYDAGHYYGTGAHSDVRFNMHNIHKQNSQANERYGGCASYTLGIKERYGNEYLDMMLDLPLKYKGIGKEKFTIDNIRNIYLPNARRIKREIQKGADFTRDQINEIIGIY